MKKGTYGSEHVQMNLEVHQDPAHAGKQLVAFCTIQKADAVGARSKLARFINGFGVDLRAAQTLDLEALLVGRRALAVVGTSMREDGSAKNVVSALMPVASDPRLPGWAQAPQLPPGQPAPESWTPADHTRATMPQVMPAIVHAQAPAAVAVVPPIADAGSEPNRGGSGPNGQGSGPMGALPF
jgi:hypothetical protein